MRVYDGPFGVAEATRLLWRAGFGPRRNDAASFASMGLDGAVKALLEPQPYATTGPEPTDAKGRPLAPQDAVGHDHLWWLDRMVRGNQPLVERMTLIWHDWFATSNAGVQSQKLMLDQNQLFRTNWDGTFSDLARAVTSDPAMLLWLNGNQNRVGQPNENYARELMELFTLGADQGYTEQDVREQARALTGWRGDNRGMRYDPTQHDSGTKTVFGQKGNFGWQDAPRLAIQNAAHPPFFVRKLWSYFIPLSELDAPTAAGLQQEYVSSGHGMAGVLRMILVHPALYVGPRMTKSPVVHTAGLLRALDRPVDTDAWASLDGSAGQRLFYPPNVAGWDDDRWLDTQTFRGRWSIVANVLRPYALDPAKVPAGRPNTPDAILGRALDFWNRPALSAPTTSVLQQFAADALRDASNASKQKSFPTYVENALRQLIAVSPDLLTC